MSSSSYSSIFDPLYCEEGETETQAAPSLLPLLLLEDDLFLGDQHLVSLLSKETHVDVTKVVHGGRREAVEWMLEVCSHFGFSTHTAILSVDYLDRFLSQSTDLQHRDKPWMVQLAAVTCVSLAAKFEETHVPLLLDLQVEGTSEYVFEAKTIQKMELLVLSMLEWKMNPVTPISFLDHVTPRLGLAAHVESEFVRRCEELLFSVVPDWRLVGYPPSVVATATMLHVIRIFHPSNPIDFHNHLLRLLTTTEESVKQCYDMMAAVSTNRTQSETSQGSKRDREPSPSSPKGVLESHYLSSDSSNDSWGSSSASPSVSSSPDKRVSKKRRVEDEPLRVLAGAVGVALGIISYVVSCLMRCFLTEEFKALFLMFPLHLWKRY